MPPEIAHEHRHNRQLTSTPSRTQTPTEWVAPVQPLPPAPSASAFAPRSRPTAIGTLTTPPPPPTTGRLCSPAGKPSPEAAVRGLPAAHSRAAAAPQGRSPSALGVWALWRHSTRLKPTPAPANFSPEPPGFRKNPACESTTPPSATHSSAPTTNQTNACPGPTTTRTNFDGPCR